jgi:hypothetical protein
VSGLKNGFAGIDGKLQAAGLEGDGVGHRPILTEARVFPKPDRRESAFAPSRSGAESI